MVINPNFLFTIITMIVFQKTTLKKLAIAAPCIPEIGMRI
jgi:hypothetical protein